MNLYNELGFLSYDAIEAAAPSSWCYVIIGARQVGKTYGALKRVLDKDIKHILLRRTNEEVLFIGANETLNPYNVFSPEYDIRLKQTKKILEVWNYKGEEEKSFNGLIMGLPTVSHIRGFNGSAYTDIIFDEFIPEKHVIVRKTEGDALLNAYTTINGNRELNGAPPLKMWLLSNSNRIDSPILEALNLTDPVLKMRDKKRELYTLQSGITIIQPFSKGVIEKRTKTALLKHLESDKNAFYKMAVENEFAYDDASRVKVLNMKYFRPLCSIGELYFYDNDNDKRIYCCRVAHKKSRFETTPFYIQKFIKEWNYLFDWYRAEWLYFADLRLLTLFRTYFNIDF